METILWLTFGIFAFLIALLIFCAWKETKDTKEKEKAKFKEKDFRRLAKAIG